MHDLFRRFSARVSLLVGSGWAVLFAVILVSATGVYFNFSDAWKVNVSLVSTLSALLLLFFLQKSQNHSDKATHLKLDELIKATDGARDEITAAEHQAERDLDDLKHDS